MKFGMFYPVAVASEADLGKGLWGLDRDRYGNTLETARQGSAFWTHWLGEFGFFEALRMKGQEGPVPKTFEQTVKSGFQLVGTPDEVGEEIPRLKEALDVEYIIFVMCGGITEQKRIVESIRLFGEKVIPKFADAKMPELALATA